MTGRLAPRSVSVLGVPMTVTDYREAVESIIAAAGRNESRAVSALAVHGVMIGVFDRAHRARLAAFDMLTPDGQPVRWAMNLLGDAGLTDRVYGPELAKRICAAAESCGVQVFLYGSRPHVVQGMARRLLEWYPELKIAGMQPSRFREATSEEDMADVTVINESGAGIVLVGLGCPLQERWVYDHLGRVNAVMVAVGAAFDFHAGTMPQAPKWMQRRGLEWAYRLAREPRRLWRRYLVLNPLFLVLLSGQMVFRWFNGWTSRSSSVADR